MILPIRTTFGRAGLPSDGVPALMLSPDGSLVGAMPAQVQPIDTAAATGAGVDGKTPEGVPDGGQSNAVEHWDGQALVAGAHRRMRRPGWLLHPSLDQTHGRRVWNRPGTYKDESEFDKWRRAGRPTSCGMGAWSDTLQDLVQAGSAAGIAASLPPGTVIQMPDGTYISNTGSLPYGRPIGPGGAAQVQSTFGSAQVQGSASPGLWILGLAAAGAVAFWYFTQR